MREASSEGSFLTLASRGHCLSYFRPNGTEEGERIVKNRFLIERGPSEREEHRGKSVNRAREIGRKWGLISRFQVCGENAWKREKIQGEGAAFLKSGKAYSHEVGMYVSQLVVA